MLYYKGESSAGSSAKSCGSEAAARARKGGNGAGGH